MRLVSLAVLAAAVGCSGGGTTPAPDPRVPDFALLDVNSTSATFNQLVSPRDKVGKVSAWYFGHAT